MPDDEYVRDPTTGQEYTIRRGNETIIGDVEVTGRLTNNGQAVGGDEGGGGSVTLETPTGAVNGVNAEFVFTAPPIFVTYQKQIQDLTDDYTLAGSTVTFVVAPVSGTVKGLVSA